MEVTDHSIESKTSTTGTKSDVDTSRDKKSMIALGVLGITCCSAPIVASGLISLLSFGIFASITAVISTGFYLLKSKL